MLIVSLNLCISGWDKILILAYSTYNNAPIVLNSCVGSFNTFGKVTQCRYKSMFKFLLCTFLSWDPDRLNDKTSVSSSPKWGNWTRLCLKSLPALPFHDWTHVKFTLPLQQTAHNSQFPIFIKQESLPHSTQLKSSRVLCVPTEAVLSALPRNLPNLPLRQWSPNSFVLV